MTDSEPDPQTVLVDDEKTSASPSSPCSPTTEPRARRRFNTGGGVWREREG